MHFSLGAWKRCFSLRLSLFCAVVLPMGLALALTGYIALAHLETVVRDRMQKDLELVARSIQLPLSHALERDRKGSMASALESAFSIGRVYGAYVFDEKGEQIAALGRSATDAQSEKLSELAAHGKEHGEFGRIGGRQVFSYFVPLTDSGGRLTGLLQLTRRASDFQEDIRAIRAKGLIGLGLGFLIMTGLVLYGHHRALGRYFASLTTSMNRVAQGESEHRVTPHGPREIVAIGRQFNRVLDSIDAAHHELQARKDREEQLRTQLRQNEKLAAIGRLAAGVAHELGTPLSVVSGKAQRTLRSPGLATSVSEALHDIRHEVARMEHIIRQLLDFSRNNAIHRQPTNLTAVAHAAMRAVDDEAAQNQVRIEPLEPEDKVWLNADPLRLEQAVVNLLRNAVQAAPGGRVILAWDRDADKIWLRVDDNGLGIPEEISTKLFEPFFTTKDVGSGTGLGLAVVHGILEEHGGRMEFGNSSLGGAFFRIEFPLP
jgi:two-component system, NtrC family, sensor kinase